jgi:outer membrane protein OmpA-like peptidoglycan-associated protein
MRGAAAALAALALLAACQAAPPAPPARQALFVVLPDADGSVGAVTVSDGRQSLVLDRAYGASEARAGALAPVPMDAAQVHTVFGAAVAARPILPRRFRLYFQRGGEQLTEESEAAYRAVFEDVGRRPVYEIEVIGHTDTTGRADRNQALSAQRAQAIRDRLVRDGVQSAAITTAGRGQIDPAVRTADNVDEPMNRRVEITVR